VATAKNRIKYRNKLGNVKKWSRWSTIFSGVTPKSLLLFDFKIYGEVFTDNKEEFMIALAKHKTWEKLQQ